MNKKLPNVFANKNTGVINNNKEKFYSKDETVISSNDSMSNKNIKMIMVRKKINDLFSSDSFVYKVKAIVTTGEGDKEYTLIAKNNDRLLTINNESIPISEILDIRKL